MQVILVRVFFVFVGFFRLAGELLALLGSSLSALPLTLLGLVCPSFRWVFSISILFLLAMPSSAGSAKRSGIPPLGTGPKGRSAYTNQKIRLGFHWSILFACEIIVL